MNAHPTANPAAAPTTTAPSRWSVPAPPLMDAEAIRRHRKNFRNVQIDAIGIGIASAAATFLPVFLTRLGASNTQVGLLTSMPGFAGLLLALPVGVFLQTRRNIVPWFSLARLLVNACYVLTGLLPFLLKGEYAVIAVLAVWGMATLPQTVVAVSFSVVMNAVAGPQGRFELMRRRWSTLGVTTAVTVALAGQVLDRISFPLNYQLLFMALFIGGLISYYFSSHIELLDKEPEQMREQTAGNIVGNYLGLLKANPAFVSFALRRFVFLSGISLGAPLFPLFFVNEVHASDSWIGIISMVQSSIMLVGYTFWTRQSRLRGGRFVLLCTTLGVAIYPALVASTHQVQMIAVFAGLLGIFQAGLDLIFFDELMKTVPMEYGATFVSLAQGMQYLSAFLSPFVGTFLADQIGLPGALLASAALRLAGFFLFLRARPSPHPLPGEAE